MPATVWQHQTGNMYVFHIFSMCVRTTGVWMCIVGILHARSWAQVRHIAVVAPDGTVPPCLAVLLALLLVLSLLLQEETGITHVADPWGGSSCCCCCCWWI